MLAPVYLKIRNQACLKAVIDAGWQCFLRHDLLRVLVQHAGKVLTHRFLLKELWDELTDAQYLRVYVRQLRQKIEADPERPQFVLTETGIGYRLRAAD